MMADPTQRDDSMIAAGLIRWLGETHACADVSLAELRRPPGGYSSETVFVDAAWTVEGVRTEESLVLRTEPPGPGTFQHYELASQCAAQRVAAAAGVVIADPVFEPDPRWIGSPFVVMPRIEGHIIDGIALGDPWLAQQTEGARRQIYRNFLTALAQIHRSGIGTEKEIPRRDNRGELEFWAEYLDWSSGGRPVATLVEGLRWCGDHVPATDPEPVLLWGDARFENMIFGDDLRPLAVLDWDMTSIGAPEHDLAWFTSLDSTMERLFGRRMAGFPTREETIDWFEALSGRPVQDFEWYETLAMVRSTAIMTRISYLRQESGQAPMLPIEENPILDLLQERLVRA